ncbi:hypothetical protein SD961_11260 [Erwinia sp. MMLR14_017]|uniref:hypothetical protein n=1 Tax=Erwinia sp. MMLR14_017 TaxID=3093842 RepID=UPI0029903FB1|nr:hypothetical protein [Erwinia sp. MMLR14_017]MDW8846463.1 hypothetical protein [Erwinia sp. MMLR14_017]
MKIACLGWGSLIWKQEQLPVKGEWKMDGPAIPIEFCRIGEAGELATAICVNAAPLPVLWAWLGTEDLAAARHALTLREGIPASRSDGIGSLTVTERPVGILAEWAQARDIEAVIWTALPARSDSVEGKIPSAEEAIAYLSGLEGEKRHHARRYIERVPAQLTTPYRRAIVEALGWAMPDNLNS